MNARDTQNTAVTASHEDTRTVQLTYAQAAALALSQAMDADPTVVALGEDLGRGGVFGQYRDAQGAPARCAGGLHVIGMGGGLGYRCL
mgnify:CR=1 FL=1